MKEDGKSSREIQPLLLI